MLEILMYFTNTSMTTCTVAMDTTYHVVTMVTVYGWGKVLYNLLLGLSLIEADFRIIYYRSYNDLL